MTDNEMLKEMVDKATDIYSDVDVPINKCLELFFLNECNMDEDDAFEKSLTVTEKYLKVFEGV